MSGQWRDSTRRARLPADWAARVAQVKSRDGYRCTHRDSGVRCPNPGTDVDHIRRGDDHSLGNLRLLCSPCHKEKTQKEAQFARKKAMARAKYPRERHPGYPG